MTTGHLVADTNLALLGNINLSHLDDARRQFVADGEGELLALLFGIQNLVFLQVIDDKFTDEGVRVLVLCPSTQLDSSVVEVLERALGKLGTGGDNLGSHVVLHTQRHLAAGQFLEFLNQDGLEVADLILEFGVNLRQFLTVAVLVGTCLHRLREEFLVDDHTAERRSSLE